MEFRIWRRTHFFNTLWSFCGKPHRGADFSTITHRDLFKTSFSIPFSFQNVDYQGKIRTSRFPRFSTGKTFRFRVFHPQFHSCYNSVRFNVLDRIKSPFPRLSTSLILFLFKDLIRKNREESLWKALDSDSDPGRQVKVHSSDPRGLSGRRALLPAMGRGVGPSRPDPPGNRPLNPDYRPSHTRIFRTGQKRSLSTPKQAISFFPGLSPESPPVGVGFQRVIPSPIAELPERRAWVSDRILRPERYGRTGICSGRHASSWKAPSP